MVIKPSIVLAAAVLTTASFLPPSTATAEDPTYLMPTGPGGGQDTGLGLRQVYDRCFKTEVFGQTERHPAV